MVANHYPVKIRSIEVIVIYRVKITPQIALDNRPLRQQLLNSILPQLKQWIGDPVLSGMTIYSTRHNSNKEQTFSSENYQLNIRQVKTFDIKGNPNMLLLFLNNALRNVMSRLNYVEIGRTSKFFDTKNRTEFDGLFMYPGFQASFNRLEGGVYLKVDSANKIVNNKNVLQVIDGIYKKYQNEDKERKRDLIKEELVNKIIMTNYGKPRYYRIEDIDFRQAAEVMLDNTSMSIVAYYKDKYGYEVKNVKQPLLKVEDKKRKPEQGPVLLIPEMCLMTGIPDDFDEMRRKKVSERTIKNPQDKLRDIESLMKGKLSKESDMKELAELGLDVSRNLMSFKAKVAPMPKLQLGKDKSVQQGK